MRYDNKLIFKSAAIFFNKGCLYNVEEKLLGIVRLILSRLCKFPIMSQQQSNFTLSRSYNYKIGFVRNHNRFAAYE